MILELAALGSWLFWEYRCAKRAGFGWREFKGVTKFLLVAPKPIPPCRACGEELPDNHLLREEIGHGAELCLDCYEEVALEAGLIRPDWFDQPLPPEGSEVPKQIEAPPDTMANPATRVKWMDAFLECEVCHREHEYGTPHACVNCDSLRECQCVLRGVKIEPPKPPGPGFEIEPDWGFSNLLAPIELETRFYREIGHLEVPKFQQKASGELYAPQPRMNCPIKNCGDPECLPSAPSARHVRMELDSLERRRDQRRRELCVDCGGYHDLRWPCLD